MSLLLDALKKAASEKEKAKSTQNEEVDAVDKALNDTEEQEDMNLDLDISVDDEVYPEIDEDVEIPGNESENVLESDKTLIVDDELESDSETEEVELDESNESAEEIIQPETKVAETDVSESMDEADLSEPVEEKPAEIIEPRIQPVIKKQLGIENKEALSELINKSNKYSRRKKLQTKIIIASTISLVFLLTAAYLYFEFSNESQSIYVENESVKPIKAVVTRVGKSKKESSISSSNNSTQPTAKRVSANENAIKSKQTSKIAIKKPSIKKQKITIAHKVVKDPTESLVRRAYNAFNDQDYKTSETLYKKVIADEPKNRDALLGLAAIAIKQQRYEYARQKYLQLRYLNPKDSIAIAGLSSIQNKVKPELNESELKFLLREQPEAAHLYFALGSLYAGQKKWAEAQTSFFSAWSAENTNSDYAFNLAVSLDQLGKKMQAKQLYELSLKLNNTSNGNFSTQAVKKRIKTLSEKND